MLNCERAVEAARLIAEAGGSLTGRTRLQKATYLAKLAGYPTVFSFEYRHFGPFSEDLADAMELANALGLVKEVEKKAEWGGRYSVYSTTDKTPLPDQDRLLFLAQAARHDAIALELAATAAFLYEQEGIGKDIEGDPWAETKRRKPDKATNGYIEISKNMYRELCQIQTPKALPDILNGNCSPPPLKNILRISMGYKM
jgi:uncharacterized protein YwgA